jgi:hypothetical protein
MFSCTHKESKNDLPQILTKFDTNTLIVKKNSNTKKFVVKFFICQFIQTYHNFVHGRKFDLSAFVAIHLYLPEF